MNIKSSSEPRQLVLSSLKCLWPRSSPALFIGQWCIQYGDQPIVQQMDHKFVDYHWDDRTKLFNDYQLILQNYEDVLSILSSALNQFHSTNYDISYWRLLLGPWLGQYITIIFDRWECVHKSFNDHRINGVCSSPDLPPQLPPLDTREFLHQIESSEWNQALLTEIVRYCFKEIPLIGQGSSQHDAIPKRRSQSIATKIRQSFTGFLLRTLYPLIRNNKYFFIDFPLGKKQIFLDLFLNQLPCLTFPYSCQHPEIPIHRDPDTLLRFTKPCVTDSFFNFLLQQVCQNIPQIYLEHYISAKRYALNMPWPANPKVIVSTNSHSTHEYFKLWACEKTNQSHAKLVFVQHGGLYGSAKFHFYEYHEQQVCDHYFTWGDWGLNYKKCIPLPSLKINRHYQQLRYNPRGGIMLITGSFHRQSYILESCPMGPQVLQYFEDMYKFVDNLTPPIFHSLKVHLYPFNDHQWMQRERWLDRFPDIAFTSGKNTMYDCLHDHRLTVGTYNSTTLLELLASDIPTVLFWNPLHSELRVSAEPFYKDMIDSGILHYDPVDAANFVSTVWNNVSSWWYSSKVVKAKQSFCQQYALTSPNTIKKFADRLKSLNSLSHQ